MIDKEVAIINRVVPKDSYVSSSRPQPIYGGSGRCLWTIREENEKEYLFGDKDAVVAGGLTMYGVEDESNLKEIWDGLPIDQVTIKRRDDGVLYAVSSGGGGGSSNVVVYLGNVAYNSVDGVVKLPAYPDTDNLVELDDLNDYATTLWVSTKLGGKANKVHTHSQYLTEHQPIDHLATSKELADGLVSKANKVHTHDQYLTEHQSLSHLATRAALDQAEARIVELEKEVADHKDRIDYLENDVNTLSLAVAKLEAMWQDKGTYLYTDKSVVTGGGITMLDK